jgi:signal transduction histidine kinase/CheY-like chemotaxis protein
MTDAPSGGTLARAAAFAATAGTFVALALEHAGVAGPWGLVALLLAPLALAALVALALSIRAQRRQFEQLHRQARREEAEIEELQGELDRRHALERDLLEAKQAAEAAVMAKGEFLATMSHEIRTPLNGIVPMLDLLLTTRLQPDQHELVRTAYGSSQQLLRIVDDILDYSKLEADKLELETTPFNLRELLEGVLQLMERSAESKGLRLHLHIDPSVRLPVRGDPVRLRQILGNLVGNAVKFTDRGSVSIQVRRIGESTTQHRLRFEVRDTGIGIEPAAQQRLFNAFAQADASTTRLYGGTGLGLAICKRIVELMGGAIGVQSEPGHGATFHFEVPLMKVHGDMPAAAGDLGGGRLLLLTGDGRLRSRLSMLLPNWGMRVTVVDTTQEALDRLRAAASQGPPWAYSVVLADLTGMRNTALALHRNLGRHAAVFGKVRQVYLYGDDEAPEELRQNASLIPRQAPDAELREAISSPEPDRRERPAVLREGDSGSLRHLHGKVLLVEDNPVNLLVAQRLLGVLGVDCDTATSGEAALLRMAGGHYQLVLMDCQMPVVDGYTATRRWRQREIEGGGVAHLPIIAMTANAMAGDRQKCLDAGMDDYLAKPVTRGQLESCLRRWLPAGGAREPGPVEATVPSRRSEDVAAAPAPVPGDGAAGPAVAGAGIDPATEDAQHAAAATATSAPAAAQVPGRDVPAAAPAPMADATAPANEPVLDAEALDELYDVIGDDAHHIVRVFLEDAPRVLHELEQAALAPDYAALRDAAHSLKSSAANLGAMALSGAARRLELGARTQSLERPAVAVALLVQEFARARVALRARLPANGTADAAQA